MTTGEKIRMYRNKIGLTQKQVAEKCGMADSAIRKYESGMVTPKYETLQRIAAALSIPTLYLLNDLPILVEIDDNCFMNSDGNLLTMDDLKKHGSQAETKETPKLTRKECLVNAFDALNDEGQEKAVQYTEDLASMEKYQKK